MEPLTALQLFGATVRARRKALGLTLRALAANTGLHRSHLSDIECGKVSITLDTLFHLAAALDVPPTHLLKPLDARPDLYAPRRDERP